MKQVPHIRLFESVTLDGNDELLLSGLEKARVDIAGLESGVEGCWVSAEDVAGMSGGGEVDEGLKTASLSGTEKNTLHFDGGVFGSGV